MGEHLLGSSPVGSVGCPSPQTRRAVRSAGPRSPGFRMCRPSALSSCVCSRGAAARNRRFRLATCTPGREGFDPPLRQPSGTVAWRNIEVGRLLVFGTATTSCRRLRPDVPAPCFSFVTPPTAPGSPRASGSSISATHSPMKRSGRRRPRRPPVTGRPVARRLGER